MTWVLILNSNKGKIFSFSKKDQLLDLVKEVHHPENKGRNEDLVSDRQGHYSSDGTGGGAYSAHTDPKEVKLDQFMLEICRWLDDARTHNKFEKLIVIASPKIHGHLSQHLDKNVEKLITQYIQKDIVTLKQHELLPFLMEHAK